MNGSRRVEWPLVLALAGFALVNAICWANVIPPGGAPDEPSHFEVVAFEAVFMRIPVFAVDDYGAIVRTALDGWRTPDFARSAQPGLAYFASAGMVKLLRHVSEPYLASRYVGAIWAAAMTIVVFVGARAMFPAAPGVPVLAAVVVTCWPMLALVFSYTNNDGLTTLVAAALVAQWFMARASGWRPRDALIAGVLAGLLLLNKQNGFVLVGATGLIAVAESSGGLAQRMRRVVLCCCSAIVTAGWWYGIAYSRYGWDLFTSRRVEQMRAALGVEWTSGRHFGLGYLETLYGDFPRYGEPWIVGTFRSAFGVLGSMATHLPAISYVFVLLITIAGVVGFVVQTVQGSRPLGISEVISLGLIPVLLALSLYRSWAFDFQAQGRYLFPAMLPFAGFVAVGLIDSLRGWARGVSGLLTTLGMFGVLTDTFLVRLLRMYDLTIGDFREAQPVGATAWVILLTVALVLSIVYWVRVGTEAASRDTALSE